MDPVVLHPHHWPLWLQAFATVLVFVGFPAAIASALLEGRR
jgi:hypothetical protein